MPWSVSPTRSTPGRPDKLRTAHLADLHTPTLILQDERDPFGNRGEVPATASRPLSPCSGSPTDHSLKPRKRSGRTLEQNTAEAAAHAARFLSKVL